MSDAIAPEGWYTVTPRIVARDARQLVEFLRAVFGATETIGPISSISRHEHLSSRRSSVL